MINTENTNYFQDLAADLAQEVELFQQLGELLKAKQSSIITGDVELLQNIVHEEQRLIPKIRKATKVRELQAAAIGASSTSRMPTPSLRELIKLSPSRYSMQLIAYREKLIISLDQIAQANRENEFLLNSSVELVRGLIQLLLGSDGNENVHYSGQGKIAEDRINQGHLDYQI